MRWPFSKKGAEKQPEQDSLAEVKRQLADEMQALQTALKEAQKENRDAAH